jgi:hypothetical protein
VPKITFLKFKLTLRLPADRYKNLVTIFESICLDLPMVLVDGNVHASVNGYFNAFETEVRNENTGNVQYFNP